MSLYLLYYCLLYVQSHKEENDIKTLSFEFFFTIIMIIILVLVLLCKNMNCCMYICHQCCWDGRVPFCRFFCLCFQKAYPNSPRKKLLLLSGIAQTTAITKIYRKRNKPDPASPLAWGITCYNMASGLHFP